MAVSAIKDFWIHPNALTITLNYFGDPQLIQTSMLAGAVIMAYRKDVISYDAAHNFREWKLQAFPTQLNDTCAYYVHAELSRSGDTAMIIYSPVKRDIRGRTLLRVEKDENGRDVEVWDNNLSTESYFIYLGTISASVDNDGATVERAWTDGFYTGTLDTDQQRMEDAAGEWKTMFNYNAVTDQIEPQIPFSKIKVMGEAIFQSIAKFVNGLIIGKRTITDVAVSSDSGNESKVSDATLSTTGYVDNEIEALDDHFLIKDDPNANQSVSGPVTFDKDVTVNGNHTVGGNQSIQGTQDVEGVLTLHNGFKTPNFSNAGGQMIGAQLTQNGIFYTAGIVAGSMGILELIYNKVRAYSGKNVFSNAAFIERCEYVTGGGVVTPEEYTGEGVEGINEVRLYLKKDEVNTAMPFEANDILYGYVNKVAESGQYAKSGQCVMHVTEVDEDNMLVIATLYPVIEQKDEMYDENGNLRQDKVLTNIPPTDNMSVAQRGNSADAEGRCSAFFIDTETSNLYMLSGVTGPNIDKSHYSVVNGLLPHDLWEEVHRTFGFIQEEDPVTYAKYGIFENILQFDHLGNPIRRDNYRGGWVAPIKDEQENWVTPPYRNTPSYYDSVTHNGSLWQCVSDYTTDEPSKGNGWVLLVARGEDGTSIKVSGSYDTLSAFEGDWKDDSGNWIAPADKSETYVVVQDLYVWDGTIWKNVGQFKGDKGDSGLSPTVNLLDNTSFSKIADDGSLKEWNVNNALTQWELLTGDNGYLGHNAIKYTQSTSSYGITQGLYGKMYQGVWYTISFVAKSDDSSASLNVRIPFTSNSAAYYLNGVKKNINALTRTMSTGTLTSAWTYYYITVQAGEILNDDIIIFGANNSNRQICVSQIKIEVATNQGEPSKSIPTAWSYSELDVKGDKGDQGDKGDKGDKGNIGDMLYPSGEWKSTEVYKMENKSVPFVKYGGNYYVLVGESESGYKGYAPNVYPNIWQPYTKLRYLFAEFLMADFARFGGDEGAVFYGKWLFSQKGKRRLTGEEMTYGKYLSDYADGSYDGPIFNESGNFTGAFIPNFSIDMSDGEVALLKLKEVYADCSKMTYINMDSLGYYNIMIEPKAGLGNRNKTDQFTFSAPLIVLPQVSYDSYPDEKSGARVSIVAKVEDFFLEKFTTTYDGEIKSINYQRSAFGIISADSLNTMSTYTTNFDSGGYVNNFIIYQGLRCKFVLIGPGDSINLRLAVQYRGSDNTPCNYWYVESGSLSALTCNMAIVNNGERIDQIRSVNWDSDFKNDRKATMKFRADNLERRNNWADGTGTDSSNSRGDYTYGRLLFATPTARAYEDNLVNSFDEDGYEVRNEGVKTILLSVNEGTGFYNMDGNLYYRVVDNYNNDDVTGDSNFDTTSLSRT